MTVPAPNSALIRSASSLSLASPEPDQAGPGLGPLDLLAGLGGRRGLGFGGRRRRGGGRRRARPRPAPWRGSCRSCSWPWARRRRRPRRRRPARGFGLGLRRRDLGRLGSPASCASSRPIAVFSAAISTVRRSIKSGPEHRDRDIALDLVAVPGREAVSCPRAGSPAARRRSSSGA